MHRRMVSKRAMSQHWQPAWMTRSCIAGFSLMEHLRICRNKVCATSSAIIFALQCRISTYAALRASVCVSHQSIPAHEQL